MAQTRSSADDGSWAPLRSVGTGSNWLGAALFLGFAGAFYAIGYHALAFAVGWLGGCVLSATLIAPRVRRFGRYTLPEFLGARYGNGATRLIGVGALLSVFFTFLMAQLYGIGIVVSHDLPIDFDVAVFIGLGGALICALLGSFPFIQRTPIAVVVVVVATAVYVTAAILLRARTTNMHVLPFEADNIVMRPLDGADTAALLVCLLLGIAALPQIRMQRMTTQLARTAGMATTWDLLLVLPILMFAPIYALGSLFGVSSDAFVLAPLKPSVVSAALVDLVAAAAVAVLLLTTTRLLHAILALLTGDKPWTGNKARAVAAISATIVIGIAAAYAAGTKAATILPMMAWGLSLAASGLFAPLALGLWWKRTSTLGAACGIAAGFGVCLFYLIGTQYFPERFAALFGSDSWWGIDNMAAGLFGIPVALAVTLLVSLVTPAPSPEMQEFVASLRRPRRVAPNQRGTE